MTEGSTWFGYRWPITFATSSSFPPRSGNLVRPLIGGAEMFGRIGEAIDTARHSIWVTIAFYAEDFRFPAGRGTFFDALDRAVARGVDVRLLVWRPNPEARMGPGMFGGTAEQRDMLARRESRIKIRWDRAPGRHCQHQKSWVVDAGQPSEIAFLGGANVSIDAMRHHDVYLEVAGPSAADIHHNFVQRWNEASERHLSDGAWACDPADTLPLPAGPSEPRGPSTVQIGRMLPPGLYRGAADGERSILEQYRRAIDAAQRTIYLENQAIPIMDVAEPLLRALRRGVDVILLVPTLPQSYVFEARLDPAEMPRFEGIEAMSCHSNFLMAGLGATYVHAKLMLVDDCWITIGSCNLHAFSLQGHSEMNAAIWDEGVARALRCALYAHHLGVDTSALDDRAAMKLYRRIAEENSRAARAGAPVRDGIAIALTPSRYGLT